MMRLYLIRHGEAEGNHEGRCLGWDPVPLTDRGRRQAQALARRLATVPLSGVYSSDLHRALETARAIAAPHGLPVVPRCGLRELHFGAWAGLTYAEMRERDADRLERWLAAPDEVAPPGGETHRQLLERVLAALPRTDAAVVVTHGGPIRVLLSHWLGCSFWSLSVAPASLTEIEWDGKRLLKVIRLGDTSHLDAFVNMGETG
ncbi:MAG TPA: histidine phosphatase family protein [Symbiobacteriaceae bacterium]